jgi:glycosyltransferase involved in cell wall biosynthesis
MALSIIILTYNADATIGRTLAASSELSDDIHVIDSGSTDRTLEIAQSFGAHIQHHGFENYGAQRNWAIANTVLKYQWELHLDADERPTPELIAAIRDLARRGFPGDAVGYFIPRLVHFLGGPIRHGGMYPIWHMRLFRRGRGRCEDRRYDQHFLVDGPTAQLTHPMIDDIRMSLAEWVTRHNRWAEAEADELESGSNPAQLVKAKLDGNPIERKRSLRRGYNRLPLLWRAFGLFLYRYIIRLGFLDGRRGLIFFVLQTFWFRFLVDAKLYERTLARENARNV